MVGFEDYFSNLMELNEIATSSGVDYWLGLGLNIILSTIVGGILLTLVMAIFSRRYGGGVRPGKAFFVVLIINMLTFFGVFGIVLSLIVGIPMIGFLLPAAIWIVVLTLTFPEMHFIQNIIIAIIFAALTLTAVPYIVGMLAGFI